MSLGTKIKCGFYHSAVFPSRWWVSAVIHSNGDAQPHPRLRLKVKKTTKKNPQPYFKLTSCPFFVQRQQENIFIKCTTASITEIKSWPKTVAEPGWRGNVRTNQLRTNVLLAGLRSNHTCDSEGGWGKSLFCLSQRLIHLSNMAHGTQEDVVTQVKPKPKASEQVGRQCQRSKDGFLNNSVMNCTVVPSCTSSCYIQLV